MGEPDANENLALVRRRQVKKRGGKKEADRTMVITFLSVNHDHGGSSI